MTEERFQTTDDGIDPVEYIAAYFTHFTVKEISVLVGAIALLEQVDLRILKSVLELEQIELEEKIGRLMQSDLIEGRFMGHFFHLDKFNYTIKKQHPNLTLDDRVFIAYLKARFEVSLNELMTAFDLSYQSTIYLLSGFVAKGLISPQKIDDDTFRFVVHYHFPKRKSVDVTDFEAQVIGYFQLSGSTTIRYVAENLAEPEHKVLATFVNLILSDMISAKFTTSTSMFGGIQLNIEVDKFQVMFQKRPMEVLSNRERRFIGYLSLRQKAPVNEIASRINLHPVDVIKLASALHSTSQLQIKMEGDDLTIIEGYPMTPTRSIEVLSQIYNFNYRVLIGILQTNRKISIKELTNLMRIDTETVIAGLITAYIEGLIEGKISHKGVFRLKAIRQPKHDSQNTLARWERILLGALISEGIISWPKIAALLEVDRETARNRGFQLISHSISKTIAKESILVMEEVPNLPPLIQISKLGQLEQMIFGYLSVSKVTSVKDIGSKFKLSNIEVFRQIYYLTGSGLVHLKRSKNRISVNHAISVEPTQSVKELDIGKQVIIQAIQVWDTNEIPLKNLAKQVEMRPDILEKHLFEIIAWGFYRGEIRKNTFYRESQLRAFLDAGVCLYCAESLEQGSAVCGQCSRRLPDCGVCKGILNSNEQLLSCPHCKNQNHANHIKQWLEIKGECPFCRNSVTVSQLLVQQPLL